MNPWKNQTDVINGFDFICKIEGSVIYEQVCIYILLDVPTRVVPAPHEDFPVQQEMNVAEFLLK